MLYLNDTPPEVFSPTRYYIQNLSYSEAVREYLDFQQRNDCQYEWQCNGFPTCAFTYLDDSLDVILLYNRR